MNSDHKTRDRLKESEATKHDRHDTWTERDETQPHFTLDDRFNRLCSHYFTIGLESWTGLRLGIKNAFKTWTMVFASLVLWAWCSNRLFYTFSQRGLCTASFYAFCPCEKKFMMLRALHKVPAKYLACIRAPHTFWSLRQTKSWWRQTWPRASSSGGISVSLGY